MDGERGALNGKSSSANYGTIDNEAGSSTQQIQEVHIDPHGWSFIKHKFREPFAEFLGTFTLVTFGVGSIAQTVLMFRYVDNAFDEEMSQYLHIFQYLDAKKQGGHLNPAVTITLAVYRSFPWLKVPIYILAQTTGAFVAAAVIYLNYHSALANFDGGQRIVSGANATAGIFATYPAPFMGIIGSFFSEALGTFFLLLVILSVTDNVRNHPSTTIVAPLTIGLGLFTIAISLGYETGFALNGARDFGPRLFTFLVGYGVEVFTTSHFYFWVPLVAPVIGGLSAGFVYDSMIYWGKSPLNRN
ncbi:17020_t:CDS:2 [Acaulospora colombiana]|uniref:17020_t:CDS:1 n=1 Tax=Acaulospora colombiana TaxID=27376 RepID=A0ACA9KBS5_9GLOM|nr:17020_t:CDS:2 [Acaulospora colombiana]